MSREKYEKKGQYIKNQKSCPYTSVKFPIPVI